jgi:aldose 1-epimerase
MIRLAADDAVVEIAPDTGGAIASFSLRGEPILRPTPEDARSSGDVRRHACYPMVPYSNRIAHARLAFGGRDHDLARNFGDSPHAIHGVGWQRAWSVASHSSRDASLALDHDAADAAAWPWPFRAMQTFALAPLAGGALLTVRLAIENRGGEPFPFGLGWHPYFPKAPDTTLAFDATHVWRSDETLIPIARESVPDAWQFASPRRLGDLALDHVFEPSTDTATLGWPSRGLEAAIDADRALDRRIVFVPAGRDFLAFEPATHMTDAFNRAARGEAGTGTRILPPGAAFSCTMRIQARATR